MTTRATKEGEHYVLNGDKKWNTGGAVASINSIFAVTAPDRGARGISAFVVHKDSPGYRVGKHEDKMGIRCVPVVELHLENCKVPADSLLGGSEGHGFKHAMMTLDRARPGVAAQAVGLAQGALDASIRYAQERRQFGRPLAEFQAIHWKLAEMATGIEAARLLTRKAALLRARGEDVNLAAAQAKFFASEHAVRAAGEALQIHGGYGSKVKDSENNTSGIAKDMLYSFPF